MRSYRSEEGKLVRSFLSLGCNELYRWMKDPSETDRRLGQSVCESYSTAPEKALPLLPCASSPEWRPSQLLFTRTETNDPALEPFEVCTPEAAAPHLVERQKVGEALRAKKKRHGG